MNVIDRYDSLIKFYAEKYDLDWKIIKKQMVAESYDPQISDLKPTAESYVGAKGLMQFMPKTWLEYDDKDNIPALDNPFNVEENIEAGCKYVKHLYDHFPEIPDETERKKMAIASYNAGRGNINEMLAHARESLNLPYSYSEWEEQGRPQGAWQEWDYAKRFLQVVTGEHAKETITYIDRIFNDEHIKRVKQSAKTI